MDTQPVLIAGKWQPAQGTGAFQSENPATRQPLPARNPVSSWHDCEAALAAATLPSGHKPDRQYVAID